MTLTEDRLSADVRAGRISSVYYLYGKEPFLVKTYYDRIIKKTVGDDPLDFNLVQISGNPDPERLYDHVNGLPFFADRKVVAINDIDPEKMDAKEFKRFLEIVSDVPDTTVLLFGVTGFMPDDKKGQTKKLIAAADKAGTVCRFELMQQSKIAELIIKKAAKQGIVISREDAQYLTERTLCNVTLVSEETSKLISFVGTGGTITRETIDSLVAKQLDTGVFELATAINSGKRAEAFRIIDDLIFEQVKPVDILPPLSLTYLDMYRAKLTKAAGIDPARALRDFSYQRNREWAFNRSMNAVAHLTTAYLRETLEILSEADREMKSTPVDGRTVLEAAVTKLLTARARENDR